MTVVFELQDIVQKLEFQTIQMCSLLQPSDLVVISEDILYKIPDSIPASHIFAPREFLF